MNYSHRIKAIQKLLNQEKFDAILISSLPNIIYLSGFSGFSTEERDGYVLITNQNQYIFTNRLYSEAVANTISHLKLCEIGKKSFIEILKEIKEKEKINKLGFEDHNISVAEYTQLKKLFPRTSMMNEIDIDSLRELKQEGEIELIEKACKIGDKAFEDVLHKIKAGISEKELAFELEMFIKRQDADLSFRTIVAFGASSSIPHHLTSDKRLTPKDQIVLIDFGVKYKNYCSDMTRTIFLGKASKEQKKMYETVRIAQEKAIEKISNQFQKMKYGQTGIQKINDKRKISNEKILTAHDVDLAARRYIEQNGFPSIPHSVGHGIGLAVHELPHISPKYRTRIEAGMVFSVEPGIYIPGTGGVRIEDLVAIKKDELKLLTHAPKQLIEL